MASLPVEARNSGNVWNIRDFNQFIPPTLYFRSLS